MIGIDIVDVVRIQAFIQKPSFLQGVFAESEIAYSLQNGKQTETLAGLYAAKEAFCKAIGTGITRRLCEIEIGHSALGQPFFITNKHTQDYEGKLHLSITHTKDLAVAVCVVF
ncbi:MAG: holo-ACP synthase [Firmicutes bacterium]|nr:holo-ACP synthase [Bacillota bacterium]